MSGDNPNNSIAEIGQNTEKNLGDLRRLVVTQTPVKDYQLTLMGKLSRSKNNSYNNNLINQNQSGGMRHTKFYGILR